MFYEVIQENRFFDKSRRYVDIDWTSLPQIVDAFERRLLDWYFDPARELARNIHFAFSVMALDCLLIDTLSQFYYGKESASGKVFKQFIADKLKQYSGPLAKPIRYQGGKNGCLKNIEDVLYHGYRCGILHQAHIPPYGLVDPGSSLPLRQFSAGHVKYKSSGSDCASVVVNPLLLLDDLDGVFKDYLRDLKDPDPRHNSLRTKFKDKFYKCFYVDVRAAT